MAELAEDLKFWQEDLPHDLSTLKSELRMWWDKWHGTEIKESLSQCDKDLFPCIHTPNSSCTVPVTSCEAERSFSSLRHTGEDRLSDLTLMHISILLD